MRQDVTLAQLIAVQREFDAMHETGGRSWNQKIDQDNLSLLMELSVALFGELGEFANVVKSIGRGDYTIDDARTELSNELADVFIYIVKLVDQLDVDLVSAFHRKLEVNRERFKKFERKSAKG
jgi:NTP pyrophosphatase (non-canonical NTP hydrolase)